MNSLFSGLKAWYNRPKSSFESTSYFLILVFIVRTFLYGLYVVPTGSMEVTMLVGDRFLADKLTVWITPIKRGEIISFNDPVYPYSSNPVMHMWQQYVWGPGNWTKRVIGIPGDHVQGKIEDGKPVIYLNGEKLAEPYLNQYPLLALWRPTDTGIFSFLGNADSDAAYQGVVYRPYDPNKALNDQPFYSINADRVVKYAGIETPKMPGVADAYDLFDVVLGADEIWVQGDNRRNSHDSRHWGPLKLSLVHGRIVYRLVSLDSEEDWWFVDLIKHPIDFWSRVRWSRCFTTIS